MPTTTLHERSRATDERIPCFLTHFIRYDLFQLPGVAGYGHPVRRRRQRAVRKRAVRSVKAVRSPQAERALLVLAIALVPLLLLWGCNSRLQSAPEKPHPQPGARTSIDTRVAAGTDDGEEYASGSVNRSSKDLDFGVFPVVGMRFVGVDIPQGATIIRAYLQFKVDEVHGAPTTLTIHGQDADDASPFKGNRNNLSSRPRTQAAIPWSPEPWLAVGDSGSAQQTPDLGPVIQEIVNRPGWSRGNALALFVSGSGERVAKSFDGDATGAPLLHVEFDNSVSIVDFSVTPGVAKLGEQVTFSWSVTDQDGDKVSCSLDVDDDGNPEYSFTDCQATTSQRHGYADAGHYIARLTASDPGGISRDKTVSVLLSNAGTVTVAAAGDIACDPNSSKFNGGEGTSSNCHMKAVADMMAGMQLAAVLPLGDVQYEDGAFDKFMQSYDPSWGRFKSITYPAVGNHEYKTSGAAGYYQYFGSAAGDPSQGYYSYDLGGWHIIVLNTQCSQVGGCSVWSPQGRWLSADLETHPSLCTLAYWHIPLFSSGGRANGNARSFWQLLQGAGVELVLSGHDHLYERFARQDADGFADPNGIRSFIVGTGGKNHTSIAGLMANSEVWNDNTYGVLKLTLHPDSYDWEFVPEPGWSFTDSGSDSCQ